MDNVEFTYHPAMDPGYALSWQDGRFKFHVWVRDNDSVEDQVFRNPIDAGLAGSKEPTERISSSNVGMKAAIEEAWRILGKTMPELRAAAKHAALGRQRGRQGAQDAQQLERFRAAFAEALKDHPGAAAFFADMPDRELLALGQLLLRRL